MQYTHTCRHSNLINNVKIKIIKDKTNTTQLKTLRNKINTTKQTKMQPKNIKCNKHQATT